MFDYIFFAIVILFALILAFYKYWFLRNPKRDIPAGNNIISPADGRIIRIDNFGTNDESASIRKRKGKIEVMTKDVAKSGYIISIFMNVFDVHYNRAPASGRILSMRHTKGKYLNTSTDDSTFENENVEYLIEDGKFRMKFIQIAGLMARRIVPFVKKGQKINKGKVFGLIRFGSQVTIITPKVELKVKVGDRVKAGESIIAER